MVEAGPLNLPDPLVLLRELSLRYGGSGGTMALAGTSLSVPEGEFAAIVGPSGCGKSTILKLVSGLLRPTHGSVTVDGTEVTRPLSIVGIAFQNPVMLPWLKTLDNVLLPLKIVRPHRSHFRRDRQVYVERARELLSVVGLTGFEYKYPWQLSGGMRQRASLCRALIHEPRMLLFDEPFAALDAFTREELWQVVEALWLRTKPTIILITHDLREAVYLADTVHVMSARPGRIVYTKKIGFPRLRHIDLCYEEEFVDAVHDLKKHIEKVRNAEAAET
jgi:NitT/TauT family transport system ATP-binding protein